MIQYIKDINSEKELLEKYQESKMKYAWIDTLLKAALDYKKKFEVYDDCNLFAEDYKNGSINKRAVLYLEQDGYTDAGVYVNKNRSAIFFLFKVKEIDGKKEINVLEAVSGKRKLNIDNRRAHPKLSGKAFCP